MASVFDIFISYAHGDKAFAADLVRALENLGFRIWYDEATLNIGDSVRRSIDKGLSESDYAVLILSPSFFEKEWPQRELDGLLAREEGTSKIILPVWHGVDFSAVRRFSPLLADRLAVNSKGPIATVAEAIARAIFRARGSISIATHMLSDQTELIVLAARPHEGFAIGVGRFPVTNRQYRTYCDRTGFATPVGSVYRDGRWQGPFVPWESAGFNHPDQPVTCVALEEAVGYCSWVASLSGPQGFEALAQFGISGPTVFLPTTRIWDLAAFGPFQRWDDPGSTHLRADRGIHHKATAPAVLSRPAAARNQSGFVDLIGNVWEWCLDKTPWSIPAFAVEPPPAGEAEVRGGCYLDDIAQVRLQLHSSMLMDGVDTRHTDLGFRVAALIELDALPDEARVRLVTAPPLPGQIWHMLLGAE